MESHSVFRIHSAFLPPFLLHNSHPPPPPPPSTSILGLTIAHSGTKMLREGYLPELLTPLRVILIRMLNLEKHNV